MKYTKSILFFIYIPFLFICTATGQQQSDENNLYRLAQTYEQAGQYETALRYYNDLLKQHPVNQNYFDGVRRVMTQLKKYPELIELINQRIRTNPTDVMLRGYLGSALFRMGNESEANKAWEDAIDVNPANTSVYRMLAEQAIDNKQYKLAVDFLLRGRKVSGNIYLFVTEVARAYALQMKYKDAMQEYVNLLINNPSMLSEVERQLTQFTALPDGRSVAVQVAKDACDDNGKNIQLRQLYAWLAMESKDYATAYEVYKEIDKIQQSRGVELMNFARRAFDEKVYGIAMDAYKYVSQKYSDEQSEPEASFYYVRCVEALNEQKDSSIVLSPLELPSTLYPSTESVPSYSGAITLYEALVKKYPMHPVGIESMYRIGYLKFNRFYDTDGALEILLQCNDLRRQILGNADADILIGDVYIAQAKLDKAQSQFEQLLSFPTLTPDQKRFIEYRLAELDYFQGKFDDAYKKLTPLTENSGTDIANDALLLSMFILENRKPSDAPLTQYAKAALLERQRKFSEAAAILQNIISSFPSAIIVDRAYIYLASMQRQSGQQSQALQTLETFLSKNPDSIERDHAQFDLAEMYQTHMHDKAKAIEMYQNLLKDFPNSLLAGEARRRILLLRQTNS